MQELRTKVQEGVYITGFYGNIHTHMIPSIQITKLKYSYMALVAYAAVYRPVRIIDLGQIYYRPPQNSKCACSVMLSGVCPALTRLDDNLLCGRAAQRRHPAT